MPFRHFIFITDLKHLSAVHVRGLLWGWTARSEYRESKWETERIERESWRDGETEIYFGVAGNSPIETLLTLLLRRKIVVWYVQLRPLNLCWCIAMDELAIISWPFSSKKRCKQQKLQLEAESHFKHYFCICTVSKLKDITPIAYTLHTVNTVRGDAFIGAVLRTVPT